MKEITNIFIEDEISGKHINLQFKHLIDLKKNEIIDISYDRTKESIYTTPEDNDDETLHNMIEKCEWISLPISIQGRRTVVINLNDNSIRYDYNAYPCYTQEEWETALNKWE